MPPYRVMAGDIWQYGTVGCWMSRTPVGLRMPQYGRRRPVWSRFYPLHLSTLAIEEEERNIRQAWLRGDDIRWP